MKATKCVGFIRSHPTGLWAATSGLMLFGLLSWAASAGDPSKSDLAISLQARKVIAQPNGQEQLQPAERAFPGEVIQYDARYVNQSSRPLRQIEPTLPIPLGMVYLEDSAKPAPLKASLDGKTFETIPLHRTVQMPNGEVQVQEVPATEYRALRWFISEMAPGTQTNLVARTRLIPVTTASAR